MRSYLSLLFLTCWLAPVPFLHAQDRNSVEQAKQRLLNQRSRPTVNEILQELSPWPESNPFHKPQHSVAALEQLDVLAPSIIANFERAYPGATFAPLGRDVVLLGDILDAFYTSLNQPGRVSRLNASTASFKFDPPSFGNLDYEEVLTRFLNAAGFDPNNTNQGPPFIIFDRTAYLSGSSKQAYRLVKAGYSAALQGGMSDAEVREFVAKFNLVSVNSAHIDMESADISHFLDSIANGINRGGEGVPPSILNVNAGPRGAFIDATSLDWHGSFGVFKNVQGVPVAEPGAPNSLEVRELILHMLFEIIERTADPRFLAKVQEEAHQLGYEFPVERIYNTEALPPPEYKIERAVERYKLAVNGLQPLDDRAAETQKYFSPNARELVQWFDNELPAATAGEKGEDLIILFIEGALAAKANEHLTGKDIRRILARALATLASVNSSRSEPVSEEFLAWFENVYRTDPVLFKVWNKRAYYFLDQNPKRRGGLSVPDTYQAINKLLEGKIELNQVLERGSSPTSPTNCPGAFAPPKPTVPSIRRNLTK